MKILSISTRYAPHIGGGAEITLETLCQGLKAGGHQISVLTIGPDPGLVDEMVGPVRVLRARFRNIYWHHRPADKPALWKRLLWHLADSYNPAMAAVAERVIKREKPDIVFVHNVAGWSPAVWRAVRRSGVPLLQVLHDFYALCPNSNMFRHGQSCRSQCTRCRIVRKPHYWGSSMVDGVIGVSQFLLDTHLAHGYFSNSKINRAVHNARQLQVPPVEHTRSTADNRSIVFGFIGTLAPAKGIEYLCSSFEHSLPAHVQLLIAGTGERNFERSLKARFESSRVQFLGHQRPEKFYPRIDALIVPSLWNEGLGMVVPEALAFGVPVIASRRGGLPEMVKHGKNGWLFEPDNPHELTDLLVRLARQPSLIDEMRPAARQSAISYLDVRSWVHAYEEIASALISDGKRSSR